MQQSLMAERAARAASAKLLERLLRGSGISTRRQHLVAGHPIDAIDKTVRQLHTGLLVMGSVSRSGLKRLFIGNTAERVLDTVDCDVLVVRPAHFRNRVLRRSRGLQLLSAQALAPQSVF
jgi:nucleotide-binding universal stress UspA family protein